MKPLKGNLIFGAHEIQDSKKKKLYIFTLISVTKIMVYIGSNDSYLNEIMAVIVLSRVST